MYLIFKNPKVCPAGQILGSSGKCVADPNYCVQKKDVGKSWYCMSDMDPVKCLLQKDGVCRDCAQKGEVYALSNSATLAVLQGKKGGFGDKYPLLGAEQKTCLPTCNANGDCNAAPGGKCVYADFGSDSKKPVV
jgi:hypothetical protein